MIQLTHNYMAPHLHCQPFNFIIYNQKIKLNDAEHSEINNAVQNGIPPCFFRRRIIQCVQNMTGDCIMKLPPNDAKAFFDTMMPLLVWIRQTYGKKSQRKNSRYPSVPEATELLGKLWENPSFIDEYLENKGASFSGDVVDTLTAWKRTHITGSFFIERIMTTGAVFISVDDGQTYLVSGITSDIEESVSNEQLPCFVETTLLPYRGRIIYDSVIRATPVYLKAEGVNALRDWFRLARNEKRLVKTLPTDIPVPEEAKWQATAALLIRADQTAAEKAVMRQLVEEENVHPLSKADLAFLEKMRNKLRRTQKDWDAIQDRLADCDVFTAAPYQDAGKVRDLDHILCDGDALLIFTTLDKCKSAVRSLSQKQGNPKNYMIQTVAFDYMLEVAKKHKSLAIIDRSDEPMQLVYIYDGATNNLSLSIYFSH